MSALPASATRWTLGPAQGKPGPDGSVRRWTEEDAQLLATKGVIATPSGFFTVGKVALERGGARCPFCGAMKAIVRPYAEIARWCFGCGRASA